MSTDDVSSDQTRQRFADLHYLRMAERLRRGGDLGLSNRTVQAEFANWVRRVGEGQHREYSGATDEEKRLLLAVIATTADPTQSRPGHVEIQGLAMAALVQMGAKGQEVAADVLRSGKLPPAAALAAVQKMEVDASMTPVVTAMASMANASDSPKVQEEYRAAAARSGNAEALQVVVQGIAQLSERERVEALDEILDDSDARKAVVRWVKEGEKGSKESGDAKDERRRLLVVVASEAERPGRSRPHRVAIQSEAMASLVKLGGEGQEAAADVLLSGKLSDEAALAAIDEMKVDDSMTPVAMALASLASSNATSSAMRRNYREAAVNSGATEAVQQVVQDIKTLPADEQVGALTDVRQTKAIKKPDVANAVIDLAKDGDSEVAVAAMDVLGSHRLRGRDDSRQVLVDQLSSDDPRRVEAAAKALAARGWADGTQEAIERLSKVLVNEDLDDNVRRAAAEALNRLEPDGFVERMLQVLEGSPLTTVAGGVLRATEVDLYELEERYGKDHHRKHGQRSFAAPEPELEVTPEERLTALAEEWDRAVAADDALAQRSLLRFMEKINLDQLDEAAKERATTIVRAALASDDPKLQSMSLVAGTALLDEQEVSDAIEKGLASDDKAIRSTAVEVLASREPDPETDDTSFQRLLAAMGDKDPESGEMRISLRAQIAAAERLARSAAPEEVAELTGAIRLNAPGRVQEAYVAALGGRDDTETLVVLDELVRETTGADDDFADVARAAQDQAMAIAFGGGEIAAAGPELSDAEIDRLYDRVIGKAPIVPPPSTPDILAPAPAAPEPEAAPVAAPAPEIHGQVPGAAPAAPSVVVVRAPVEDVEPAEVVAPEVVETEAGRLPSATGVSGSVDVADLPGASTAAMDDLPSAELDAGPPAQPAQPVPVADGAGTPDPLDLDEEGARRVAFGAVMRAREAARRGQELRALEELLLGACAVTGRLEEVIRHYGFTPAEVAAAVPEFPAEAVGELTAGEESVEVGGPAMVPEDIPEAPVHRSGVLRLTDDDLSVGDGAPEPTPEAQPDNVDDIGL